jgi:hypothetical protein
MGKNSKSQITQTKKREKLDFPNPILSELELAKPNSFLP